MNKAFVKVILNICQNFMVRDYETSQFKIIKIKPYYINYL